MPSSSQAYRQFARRALAQTTAAKSAADADIAAAFHSRRQALRRTLVAVFGPTAVDALFERSAHLALNEYEWLAAALATESAGKGGSAKATAVRSPEEAFDGFAAVLGFDIGLLVAFVGEDLILPLVQKAWGPVGCPPWARGESD